MGDLICQTCTHRGFSVVDPEKFETDLLLVVGANHPSGEGWRFERDKEDGTYWLGGCDANRHTLSGESAPEGLAVDDDGDVDIAELVQKHIKPGDVWVAEHAGSELHGRYMCAWALVVTKKAILFQDLATISDQMIRQATEQAGN